MVRFFFLGVDVLFRIEAFIRGIRADAERWLYNFILF